LIEAMPEQETFMSTRIAQFTTFFAITLFFAVWSAHVALPDAGGAGSGVSDACTARLVYEFSKSAAEGADEQYKKLDEPDWAKLTYRSIYKTAWGIRDEKSLEKYLSELTWQVEYARKRAAKAGNLTPEQAKKNHEAAAKRYKELEQQHQARITKRDALGWDIGVLKSDIAILDGKLSAAPAPKPGATEDEAKIKKYEAVITSTQTKIQGLTGTDDIDEARKRVADPNFKNFSSPEIKQAKITDSRAGSLEEMRAAEGALNKAIEDARKETQETLSEYSVASRALTKLQSSTPSDANAALREQRVTKQKQMQEKIAEKERVAKQKPQPEDVDNAFRAEISAREQADNTKDLRAMEADLKQVEPWINARLARNKTEQRMKDAQSDYLKAITLKDSKLGKAREDLSVLQSWISGQRAGLQGREQAEEYWRTVAEIKSRARIAYTLMESDLSSLDCFGDVKNFLDDIRARRGKVEAIKIGTPVTKAPPRVASTPRRSKPRPAKKPRPTAKKPAATPTANFSGEWNSSEGRMTLDQSGISVSGTYAWAGGKITGGVVTGNTMKFKWMQTNNRAGTGKFTMLSGGQSFNGEWVYTHPASEAGKGGRWTGNKISK
jgi:hypothetical protein